MKRKLTLLLVLALTLCLTLAFSSCNANTKTDTSTQTGTETTSPTNTQTSTGTSTDTETSTNTNGGNAECEHVLETVPAIQPTCTETGLTEGLKCSKCKEFVTKQYVINPLGHDYIDHDAKAPTCSEIGWDEYQTCSRCDYTSYKEISALGHTEKTILAVEPTCTETGLTEGTKCSVCDEILIEQEVIKALGHSYEGNYTCLVCKNTLTTSEGLEYSLSEDGTYYTVTGIGTCTDTDIVIPYTYNDLPVTTIGTFAFYNCTSLTSIMIPDNVTTIEGIAFGNCTLLTSAIMPDSITTIGSQAFKNCTSLTSITIPNSVTTIEQWAFYGCKALEEINFNATSMNNLSFDSDIFRNAGQKEERINVTIGKNVTKIPAYLFNDTYITSVVFEKGSVCESIKNSAFENCTSLTSITIPDSITVIENCAFENCTSLTSVNISDIASWCGISFGGYGIYTNPLDYANNLYLNGELVTDLIIPSTVTEIKDYAFYNCESLTSVTIHDNVTSIGKEAFYDCTALTEINFNATAMNDLGSDNNVFRDAGQNGDGIRVTIGKNVTKIPAYLFDTASYITSVVFEEGSVCESIGDFAFIDCTSLTSITIPDSVTTIEQWAFHGCDSLTSITLPDSITAIDRYTFYGCNSLASITIPDSVTSIGDCAFEGCNSLANITIPNGVTSIGEEAFEDCSSLTSITIPDSVTSIGDLAFRGCASLTSITIGNGVTSIGYGMFSDCSSLASITIPDSVTSIKGDAFSGCTSLASITIPSSVTYIEDDALSYCGSLTDIIVDENNTVYKSINGHLCSKDGTTLIRYAIGGEIPQSVTAIAVYAFSDCESLESIEIPNGVTEIGRRAFSGCSSLVSVEIPNGVIEINDYVFYHCSSLLSITISDNVTSIGKGAFLGCKSLVNITIPDSVTTIDEYAFQDCTSLTSLTIGKGVTEIESYAFSECTALTEINFNATSMEGDINNVRNIFKNAGQDGNGITMRVGKNVTRIPEGLFFANKVSIFEPNISGVKLTSVIFEEKSTCESIGAYAFNACTSLKNITIPNSVISIEGSAFGDCTSLTSIVIPDSITSIGNSVFSNCASLTSVTIPNSVTLIAYRAFYGCTSLTSITIPDSVTSIGAEAFYNCDSLASVTIPNSVTSITYRAFQDCTSLTSITIPDTVTSIGSYAFYNCTALEKINFNATAMNDLSSDHYAFSNAGQNGEGIKVTIGKNVTKIPAYLFDTASYITSVEFEEGSVCESIRAYAFYYCTSLTSITIPNGITSIGQDAFKLCYKIVEVYNLSSLDIKAGSLNNGYIGYYAKVVHTSLDEESILKTTEDGYVFAVVNNSEIYLVDYIGNETELTLPESYNGNNYEIYQYAFYKRNDITKVTIPDNVTTIEERVFEGCTSLTSITIPNSVTSIEYRAFYGCTSLTSVTIPNSVTSIGGYAFYNCDSLASVTIPNSVTSIGGYVFYSCDSLTIYCEAIEQPNGWDSHWNSSDSPVYWYSETEPTSEGNYWHYGDNGEIVVWE